MLTAVWEDLGDGRCRVEIHDGRTFEGFFVGDRDACVRAVARLRVERECARKKIVIVASDKP